MQSKNYFLSLLLPLLVLARLGLAGSGELNAYHCPNASVTIIEESISKHPGFFASTGDANYAFFSHKLEGKGWQALSINGDNVRIVTIHNKVLRSKLSGLSEHTKLELAKIKNTFTSNLAGISLSSCSEYIYENEYQVEGKRRRSYYKNYQTPAVTYAQPALVTSYAKPIEQQVTLTNLQHSKLKKILAGDLYHLCLNYPVIDIFSSSVSLRKSANGIIFYRDLRYFVYRKENLPLNINTLVVNGNLVFFVYNDNTIQVKTSTQLDNLELDLVIDARQIIKDLQKHEENAIEVKLSDQLKLHGHDEVIEELPKLEKVGKVDGKLTKLEAVGEIAAKLVDKKLS